MGRFRKTEILLLLIIIFSSAQTSREAQTKLKIEKKNKEIDYVDLRPFVSYAENCFIQLFVDNKFDFSPFNFPVSVATSEWASFGDLSKAWGSPELASFMCPYNWRRISERFMVSYYDKLCIPVLRNFHIKGINCLSVVSVFLKPKHAMKAPFNYVLASWNGRQTTPAYVYFDDHIPIRTPRVIDYFPSSIYFQFLISDDADKQEIQRARVPPLKKPAMVLRPVMYFLFDKAFQTGEMYIEPWVGHGATTTGIHINQTSKM